MQANCNMQYVHVSRCSASAESLWVKERRGTGAENTLPEAYETRVERRRTTVGGKGSINRIKYPFHSQSPSKCSRLTELPVKEARIPPTDVALPAASFAPA